MRANPDTRVLEHEDGKQEFSYPTVREDVAEDGVLHVSYTFKRQTIKYSMISEDWIMLGTTTPAESGAARES